MNVKRITSWESLIALQQPSTLYRGQSDASWELSSSLERACLSIENNLANAAERENSVRQVFKRHYHDYSTDLPEPDDELRWLAIMQHHGAPTRLMDWTFSVLVAAYFAVEDATRESAVWQLNNKLLRSSSDEYLRRHGIEEAGLNVARGRVSREEAKERFSELYLSNRFQFVRAMTPYYMDRRLIAQQGTFVCQGDVSSSFTDNLNSMESGADVLIKHIIPDSMRSKILYGLYGANIGRFTLFPGVDGFSQSLRIYHPSIWPPPDPSEM